MPPWLVLYMGVEFLCVPADAHSTYFTWDWGLPVILVVGVIHYLAYGADLPGSNRRFSRLR